MLYAGEDLGDTECFIAYNMHWLPHDFALRPREKRRDGVLRLTQRKDLYLRRSRWKTRRRSVFRRGASLSLVSEKQPEKGKEALLPDKGRKDRKDRKGSGKSRRAGETMNKALAHFHTITKHKILVMKECFRGGAVPAGAAPRSFQIQSHRVPGGDADITRGPGGPNNAEREDKGYSSAWLHHKGRNKHHYEYWIDYSLDGKHLLAGYADAGPVCGGDVPGTGSLQARSIKAISTKTAIPLSIIPNGKAGELMHPETRALLEKLLHMLADKGEEETYRYIKKEVPEKIR